MHRSCSPFKPLRDVRSPHRCAITMRACHFHDIMIMSANIPETIYFSERRVERSRQLFGEQSSPLLAKDSETLSCLTEGELKKRLHKAARAELSEQLVDGECAVIAIEGVSSSAMIVTNQNRVL